MMAGPEKRKAGLAPSLSTHKTTSDSLQFEATRAAAQIGPMRSDWHRVGAGLSVQFTFSGADFNVEWSPRRPTQRELSRIMDRYRTARDAFLTELSRRLGGAIAVVELPR